MHKVLITGAYGLIGNIVYRHLDESGEHEVYGLSRRRLPSDRLPESQLAKIPDDRFFLADLTDEVALRRAVKGMDAIVHMAANADGEAEWDSVLNSNIIGTYNVYEACRLAGVPRIVFASSIMTIFGYALEEPYKAIHEARLDAVPESVPLITAQDPARPTALYSCSKVWGEAMAHMYAHVHGMSCLCIRIGWVVSEDKPPDEPYANPVWCSQRDIAQLVERCLAAPESVRYDLFYGLSDNEHRWADIAHAREVIGYVPLDRAEDAR
jgi:nucleoside-diphosphate-sugar epimerase